MTDVSHFPQPVTSPVRVERAAAHYALQGSFLRLDFAFVGDRWQHRLGLVQHDAVSPVLLSQEGRPDDPTPASPAFQDLRLESFSAGIHEFQLMGQAGSAVYSTAIRFDDSQAQVEFDTCARLRKPIAAFPAVSSYALSPGWSAVPIAPGKVSLACSAESMIFPSIKAELLEIPHHNPQSSGSPQIDLAKELVIGWPTFSGTTRNPGQHTLRWRYRIALISPVR